MVNRTHDKARRRRCAWRRNLAIGGFASATLAFYFMLLRKRLIERHENVIVRPETADRRENPKTAFEPTDWQLAPVAAIYVGTLLLLVISTLVLIPAYPNALPDADRTLHIRPPGPRLQTNPETDLQRFQAEERKRLTGYHWVDKEKGVVRIPIEEEMKKLARTGIDGFPGAQQ